MARVACLLVITALFAETAGLVHVAQHVERKVSDPSGERRTYVEGSRQSLELAAEAAKQSLAASAGEQLATFGRGSPTNSDNLCSEGKLLPELYLLGAQKCATSSLADDLMQGGLLSAGGQDKEFHFFDYTKGEGTKAEWLAKLPDCPANRTVLADFTPKNLRLVIPGALAAVDVSSWSRKFSMPLKLYALYPRLLLQRVTFTVMLREPLHRFQSHFYQQRHQMGDAPCDCRGHRCRRCKMVEEGNLSSAINESLRVAREDGMYNDFVWGGMYGQQVEAFLRLYEPRNFVFVPFWYYIHNPASVCWSFSARLQYKIDCKWIQTAKRRNTRRHASLDDEVPEHLRQSFAHFMSADRDRLVALLASAHLRGAVLAGYEGAPGLERNVSAWLTSNW